MVDWGLRNAVLRRGLRVITVFAGIGVEALLDVVLWLGVVGGWCGLLVEGWVWGTPELISAPV